MIVHHSIEHHCVAGMTRDNNRAGCFILVSPPASYALSFSWEFEIPIFHKDNPIGTRRVDFFVAEKVMVEIKDDYSTGTCSSGSGDYPASDYQINWDARVATRSHLFYKKCVQARQ
jgi:hypothetical protein